MFIIPIIFGYWLYRNYDHLDEQKYIEKYEVLYNKVSILRGDKYTVLYYTYYLLKRWFLALIPMLAGKNSALQIFFLLNINLSGIIIYGSLRAHDTRWRRLMEFFNEAMLMLISYSILCMTLFN